MKLANLLKVAAVALLAVGCNSAPQLETMKFTNNLTAEEIAAGKFTPEVMWKMGRVGSQTLSPNGEQVAFTITYYNMSTNKGTTSIYLTSPQGGKVGVATVANSTTLLPTVRCGAFAPTVATRNR